LSQLVNKLATNLLRRHLVDNLLEQHCRNWLVGTVFGYKVRPFSAYLIARVCGYKVRRISAYLVASVLHYLAIQKNAVCCSFMGGTSAVSL
jgi:hypothetical protein